MHIHNYTYTYTYTYKYGTYICIACANSLFQPEPTFHFILFIYLLFLIVGGRGSSYVFVLVSLPYSNYEVLTRC